VLISAKSPSLQPISNVADPGVVSSLRMHSLPRQKEPNRKDNTGVSSLDHGCHLEHHLWINLYSSNFHHHHRRRYRHKSRNHVPNSPTSVLRSLGRMAAFCQKQQGTNQSNAGDTQSDKRSRSCVSNAFYSTTGYRIHALRPLPPQISTTRCSF